MRCVYCNDEHFSASCNKVTTVTDRKKKLRLQGRCFLCLRPGHRVQTCENSTRNCRHCGRRHHQSICDENRRTELEPKIEPKTTNIRNEETRNETENQTTIASTTTRNRKVLLQTAKTTAFNNGKPEGVPVRILFDSGSQRSYVTEELQRKLKLKTLKKETVYLNTFGGETFAKKVCNLVSLKLKGEKFISTRLEVRRLQKRYAI